MNAHAEQPADMEIVMQDPAHIRSLTTVALQALSRELEQQILLGATELRVWGTLARVHNELAKRKRTPQTS